MTEDTKNKIRLYIFIAIVLPAVGFGCITGGLWALNNADKVPNWVGYVILAILWLGFWFVNIFVRD